MLRIRYLLVLLVSLMAEAEGQDTLVFSDGSFFMYGVVGNDDTVFISTVQEANIGRPPRFSKNRDMRRYRKLIYNIRAVYPYARIAGDIFRNLEDTLATMKTAREQNAYTKRLEDEIKARYEEELKNLTVTQGRILIKLIDRETGQTSYALVQELRGNFQAFLWQTLARLFGSSLKSEWDPKGEDQLMNEIIEMMEAGTL